MPNPDNTPPAESHPSPHQHLSFWDSSSIIIGIIIGSSIYCSIPRIAREVPSAGWLAALWVLGAVFTVIGALCYAEMGTAYPKSGGDYVFLSEAFGRKLGFIYAWTQFWIVRPGSVGITAFVFADYANQIFALPERSQPLVIYAVLAVVALTGINLLGIRAGKMAQNLLTLIKLVGLLAILAAGMMVPPAAASANTAAPPVEAGNIAIAMIFIFYAYSGWNDFSYVSAEVRNPRKNILWALALSTAVVAAIYIAVNLAFVRALGLEGVQHGTVVAVDVLNLTSLGAKAGQVISILICITALGGINGMLFAGARIFYAVGTDHRLFSWLGRWSSLADTPARPLIIQGIVTAAVIIGFGWSKKGTDGFEAAVAFTSPSFWMFFLLAGMALFVLCARGRAVGGYRVPLYPLLPALFCLSSGYMFYKSLPYAYATTPRGLLASIAVLAIGGVLAFWVESRESTP